VKNNELIDDFAAVILQARKAAVQQLTSVLTGYRFKNPDVRRQQMQAFVETLSPEQRRLIVPAVTHFVDEALFKLITSLEGGEGPIDFELTVKNSVAGSELVVIGDEDFDLQHKFFQWISKTPSE
jgi:hypothetical protein